MTISYQYHGPCPTSVNPNWSTHTDEYVVCLLSGKLKKKIEEGYLRSLGHSRKSYLEMFPNAPMMANTSRQRMAEKTESRINSRRENLTTLNRREDFQEKRRKGVEQYWGSSNSVDRRRDLSNKAKEQHTNGLGEHINEVYWNTVYQGSAEQKRRRISASGQFSNFPKQPFRDTHLETMSTYEVDFLIYLENQGVALDRVENGIVFYGDDLFYPSDFLLDGTIVIEIKSSYIQNLQEAKRPGCLQAKKELVERHGFSFIYVLDKDYSVITEYL